MLSKPQGPAKAGVPTDIELVHRYVGGEEHAFEILLARHKRNMAVGKVLRSLERRVLLGLRTFNGSRDGCGNGSANLRPMDGLGRDHYI
jgi:hypothetical protein